MKKIAGYTALIVGIIMGLASLFSIMGYVIMITTGVTTNHSVAGIIISILFSAVSFYVGYVAIKAFAKKKGLPFYNTIILVAMGLFNFIGSIITIWQIGETIKIWQALCSISFTIIFAASFILCGVHLIGGPEKKKQKKKESKNGKTLGIIGIVCAAISTLFVPPLFGIAAIVLGILARKRGEKNLGTVSLVLGIALMIIGMALGAFLAVMAQMNAA